VGRLDEAVQLFVRTWPTWSGARPRRPGHPSSRNNLADAYQEVGRLDEAIQLYTRTLTDRERVLGPDHPDTLLSRNNLADACEGGGPAA
jgi:tetratricopeptide (TPR) repeat protein